MSSITLNAGMVSIFYLSFIFYQNMMSIKLYAGMFLSPTLPCLTSVSAPSPCRWLLWRCLYIIVIIITMKIEDKITGKGENNMGPKFWKDVRAFLFWILPARSSTKDGNGEIHPYFATSKLRYRCQLWTLIDRPTFNFNHVYFSSSPTTSSNVLYGQIGHIDCLCCSMEEIQRVIALIRIFMTSTTW